MHIFFQEEALQIVYVDYDEGHARHSGGDFAFHK
jgi:hypothetical protein